MGKREASRRDQALAVMNEAGLDGYLIENPVNVSYLTGFRGDDSLLWIGDAGFCLLSDTRFEEQIKEECPDVAALIRHSGQTTRDLLKIAVSDVRFSSSRPRRIGFESATTTVAYLDSLRKNLPDVEFVGRFQDVERLRSIKDEDEIVAIQNAIDVSIDAYRDVRGWIGADANEVDLRDELEYRMRKRGGDDVSFPSIIAFDERAALPHAIPTRGGRYGDAKMVLIDWGAKKDDYVGDLTRSFLTERGLSDLQTAYRKKFQEVFKIVLEAHDKAIAAIKPGVSCCDIDKIARDTIRDAGYGDYFGHGLGHGIGRVVHDFGGFSPSASSLIMKNMIVTVEPGIYLPGWGGIRIEDDVLVTETGSKVLSKRLSVDE